MIKPWFFTLTAAAILSWPMDSRADDLPRGCEETVASGPSPIREAQSYKSVRRASQDRTRAAQQVCSQPLRELLDQSQQEALYQAPARAELDQAERQFAEELAGRPGRWETLGMRRVTVDNPALMVVRETDNRKQGRGVFAFRKDAGRDWLVQAPHSHDDAHTGVLARHLFNEAAVRAAMWNTVGRGTPAAGGAGIADLAHLETSYWQSLTRAFAARFPTGQIIQLHGFEPSRRETLGARHLDMIISAGRTVPPAWVRTAAACLKRSLAAYRTGLYPDDISELGGTTNAQGRLLRSLGHAGFVHIEMSLSLREDLVQDETLRRRFIGCFDEHGR